MRLSEYFLPILKESPAEADTVSHRLMLRGGFIRQAAAGIYSWLPLGLRVLKKIEAILRDEQEKAGAIEMLMPTLQPAELWKRSGRYDGYGEEMLRIADRQNRELLYGPTNEEMATEIAASALRSYRDAGKILFHIQWKFRDEIRPRFGVMRGREFLMQDGYSFDADEAAAKRSYEKMFVCYLRSFARMGLKPIPIAAETGPIGGDLSHEFVILAKSGESEIFCDRRILSLKASAVGGYKSDLSEEVSRWTSFYAAESARHDPKRFDDEVAQENRLAARGVEIGHIFFFGDKYAKALRASFADRDGKERFFQSGSYGIGVSRLPGAIIEASHDEHGIVWPKPVAPFAVGLLNLNAQDKKCAALCDQLYAGMREKDVDVLYDDSDERAGAKFSTMDLIGTPTQLIVGPRDAKDSRAEIKDRATGERRVLSAEDALRALCEADRARP